MNNLKYNPIGIYEKAMPNSFDWKQKIEVAKKAGYDFIEISIDESDERLSRLNWSKKERVELKELLNQNDFHIKSMCLSGHRKFPFGSKDEKVRNKAYEIMDNAIRLAVDLGIRNIQLAGYDVYYETGDKETEDLFIKGLIYATEKASRENIMLSIEIMDTEFIGTITRCLKYINTVKSPWLNIYPDLGNLTQWAEDPSKELELGISHIVAVHLKDTKPGVFKCVPFGEGTVDFSGLLNKLRILKYTGPFLVEMWADNDKMQSEDEIVNQIKTARLWLQKRMEEGLTC
ncbi:L-ribulose-5-phosphate 3-epimerase [Clostridiaceae bacterium M8S5]|nr:L-ribulose-5-phosphate 3-epimerase [Clostridiaceae bacterium M8S5]